MQIATEILNTLVTNIFYTQVSSRDSTIRVAGRPRHQHRPGARARGDPEALVEPRDRLLGGRISTAARRAGGAAARSPAVETGQRVAEALYLLATSPEFAVQR